jgi:enamine deaminase RidA (YjgF/YER057c/UK114 family)
MTEHDVDEGLEKRLARLGLSFPPAPMPFGPYAEAARSGNLLFLSGCLPALGAEPKFRGRLGAELDAEQGQAAARLAALDALAIAKGHLGRVGRIARLVRHGVILATTREIFGAEKNSARLVYGVTSLPFGVPVELEVIFEVAPSR